MKLETNIEPLRPDTTRTKENKAAVMCSDSERKGALRTVDAQLNRVDCGVAQCCCVYAHKSIAISQLYARFAAMPQCCLLCIQTLIALSLYCQ